MCLDERSSIFIESDSLRFIVDLYPNGAEFYNLSIYNISEGWMNYNIKLDGSYYSEFYRFLINFFQNKVETKKIVDARDSLKNLELDDLVRYGLIPEFIGRIPVCAVLDRLTKETLESITTFLLSGK